MNRTADKSELQPTVDPLEERRRRREEREAAAAGVFGTPAPTAPAVVEQDSDETPARGEAPRDGEGDDVTVEAAGREDTTEPAAPAKKTARQARRSAPRPRPVTPAAEGELPMPASKQTTPRVSMSTRLRADLSDALQQFVVDHRVKVQDCMDLAVEEFLSRRGYPPAES
jgi:hypothetical protein